MKTPCFRFTMLLAKYPASDGTTTYRWSQRPLADLAGWSEGRLFAISDIRRAGTDQDGNYELSKFSIEGSDDDHAIRTLLATANTAVWYGREAFLEVLSEAGRSASLAWRVIARGRISSVTAVVGHRFSAQITDLVGSQFSAFNLNKTLGVFLGAEHTHLPETSRARIYPMIVGEWSDHGRTNINGGSAEKGILPVVDSGDYDPSGSTAPPVYAAPPVITASSVVGAAGSASWTYGASVITPYGESMMSAIVTVTGAPSTAEMSLTRYVSISGTYDPGPLGTNLVRIWGRSSNPPATWLDEANVTDPVAGTWGYLDGAANYPTPYRDELDVEKAGPSLTVSTALLSNTIWGRLVVSIGVTDVTELFWSDLADQAEPKRILADPALDGIEFLIPSSAAWPHPDPFIELTNPTTGETIRMTVIYVRGPRLNAHRDGSVTIAVNGCGMEDVGDGSGLMVDAAFWAGQLFINEHILKNAGTGYRSGNYGPLELYANGDAQLWTSQWTAAQTVSIARIGGSGYMAGWTVHAPITVREWVRRFCLTFDCRLAVNAHGQIFPIVIDDLATPATGHRYRERVEQVDLVDQQLAQDEIENRITYSWDFDPDGQVFAGVNQVVLDLPSIAAHVPGGVLGTLPPAGIHEGPVQELYGTRDVTTASDSRARRLYRNKLAPFYPTHAQDLGGLEDDLGAQVQLEHRDLIGSSADLVVLKHIVRCAYGQISTELTGIAVNRLQTGRLTLPFTIPGTLL